MAHKIKELTEAEFLRSWVLFRSINIISHSFTLKQYLEKRERERERERENIRGHF